MLDATDFINQIMHAESRYDPVKAHEYYLRTRELKGNGRNESDLKTEKQKEGWTYVKSEVSKEKQQALENAAEANAAAMEGIRQKGQQLRDELSARFQIIMDQISEQSDKAEELIAQKAQDDQERIVKEMESKIGALPPRPLHMSKYAAQKFDEKRRVDIAKIKGDAGTKLQASQDEAASSMQDLKDSVTNVRSQERDSAVVEREVIGNELRASVDKAREAYVAARESIKARYETELDREFNSIRTNVR